MKDMIFTPELAKALLDRANEVDQASVFESGTQRPLTVQKVLISFNGGAPSLPNYWIETKPYKLGFPFKAVAVLNITNPAFQGSRVTDTPIKMKYGSPDSLQSPVELKLYDTFSLDKRVSEAYLYFDEDAPALDVELLFLYDSKLDLGQTAIVDVPPSLMASNSVTLLASTPEQVLPDTNFPTYNIKSAIIQNVSGADLYIAGSNVVDNTCFSIPNNGYFKTTNIGEVWVYSVAGGNIKVLVEF